MSKANRQTPLMLDIQPEQANHLVTFKGNKTKSITKKKKLFFLLFNTSVFFHMLYDIICNILYSLRIQFEIDKNQNYFILL